MCIVSVVVNQGRQAIVTFNRDEDPSRPFREPAFIEDAAGVFCPLDLLAGGTWIGKNKDYIMFLQNGGTKRHKRQPPYGQSRGTLIMELLKGISTEHIFDCLHAIKTEPFTLCTLDLHSLSLEKCVYEDEAMTRTQITSLHEHFFINCSSTLYTDDAKSIIAKEFRNVDTTDAQAILEFHRQHAIGMPENPYVRQPVSTSSIMQFRVNEDKCDCTFINLVNQQVSDYQLY